LASYLLQRFHVHLYSVRFRQIWVIIPWDHVYFLRQGGRRKDQQSHEGGHR
jgi:hypothetical protein